MIMIDNVHNDGDKLRPLLGHVMNYVQSYTWPRPVKDFCMLLRVQYVFKCRDNLLHKTLLPQEFLRRL